MLRDSASVSKQRFASICLYIAFLSTSCSVLASKAAVNQLDLLCKQRLRMISSFHVCLLPGGKVVAVYGSRTEKPLFLGGIETHDPSVAFDTVSYEPPLTILASSGNSPPIRTDLTSFFPPDALRELKMAHALQDTPCSNIASQAHDGPPSPTPVISVLRAYGIEVNISCHENDLVCRFIDEVGYFANETLSQVALIASPGFVVDVGTHVGVVSIFAAMMGHDVFGVEAASISVRRLQHNIAVHKLHDRVTVLPVAVGREYGCAEHSVGWHMHQGANNYGASSIVQWQTSSPEANGHKEYVSVVPLQDWLPERRAIDLLKMDIEGSECHALLGLRRVFAERRVKLMVLEINSEALASAGCSNQGIFYILQQFCMKVQASEFDIVLGDLIIDARPDECTVPPNSDVESGLTNVLGRPLP